jgi:radical SAM superfamily enzyme YgiQ (UPF0313 family)
MRVCLISPLITTELEGTAKTRADIVRRTEEPPTGILTLAALLEGKGIHVDVFDVNRLFRDIDESVDAESRAGFFDRASAEIAAIEADVFGFGTISGSYPLTIRLAAAAKCAHPEAVVVFGGPQATVLDIETLEAFSSVDFIVRGEADETFPRFLETLEGCESPASLPGISYRTGGVALRTADAPAVMDLDSLPMPAFHLWDGIRGCAHLSLEAGRGCPFTCTFCSSSAFFSRRYRIKSPSCVIGQMKLARQTYATKSFYLIHDTFTAGRDKVIAFCEALLNCGDHFEWTCSARTDCLNKELLDLMEKAGCTGIFFGIETGSARLQEAIGKRLDLDEALDTIRYADSRGVGSTVSLITGFPDEVPADFRNTVNFFFDSLLFDRVTGQLHLLAPLPGSPLFNLYRAELVWDGVFSDVMLQNWREDVAEYDLIRQYPQVFPDFYAVPSRFLDRRYLADFRDFLVYGTAKFRWLFIALHQHSDNLLDVFERWRSWSTPWKRRVGPEYYTSAVFNRDFLEFVGSAYIQDDDPEVIAVATLLEYEVGLECIKKSHAGRETTAPTPERELLAGFGAVPRLAPKVALLRLAADYQCIIEHLKNRKAMSDVPRRPVVVAYRQSPDNSGHVLQLSPLSSALIGLCDGIRTVAEIAEVFPELQKGLDRLPKKTGCLFALNALVEQGLIIPIPSDEVARISARAAGKT